MQHLAGGSSACNQPLNVWDTEYVAPRTAFSYFREAICKVYMPWSPEFKSSDQFQARVSAHSLGQGAIGKHRSSPFFATRSNHDIASSPFDCFYANYLLSGALRIEQSGRSNFLKAGDFAVFDGTRPVTCTAGDDGPFEVMVFLIPKSRVEGMRNAEALFDNVYVDHRQLIAPLASCLYALAETLDASSTDTIEPVFDAVVSLLPVAAKLPEEVQKANGRLHEQLLQIAEFVRQNLHDPELSPLRAALHVGISVRQLHKLFAGTGTTFWSFVKSRRLDLIKADLLSPHLQKLPVSAIAFRWGFRDMSTFSRSFRKRFSCSPNSFRSAFMSHAEDTSDCGMAASRPLKLC